MGPPGGQEGQRAQGQAVHREPAGRGASPEDPCPPGIVSASACPCITHTLPCQWLRDPCLATSVHWVLSGCPRSRPQAPTWLLTPPQQLLSESNTPAGTSLPPRSDGRGRDRGLETHTHTWEGCPAQGTGQRHRQPRQRGATEVTDCVRWTSATPSVTHSHVCFAACSRPPGSATSS